MFYKVGWLILMLAINVTKQQSMHSTTEKLNGTECDVSGQCPTWFTCKSVEKRCKCQESHTDAILCDNDKLLSAITVCNCVTYDEGSNLTSVGSCFYGCKFFDIKHRDVQLLPSSPEILLNTSVCTHFHRTGLLCGDCEEGYSPLVHSYNLSCVKCPDGHKNWWKFALAAFPPITLFYFFVAIFKINSTSSRLHGVVLFSQVLSMPIFVRRILLDTSNHHIILTAVKVLLVFYSHWNLDPLRSVIPEICLNVTTLQALALEYLIAFYPFLLMFLSYLFIELYDRKFRVIVAIWKPFQSLLSIFHRSWDVRTSVIDSFATFFILSYVKTLSVASDILVPTLVFHLGRTKPEYVVYYSPTITYFGYHHLPYAILAIVSLVVVNIPIVAIILYPCKSFQRILSLFLINWHFLQAFVDSFQGYFKDRTEHGRFDGRWFSAIKLLLYLQFFVLFALTLSDMYLVYAALTILVFSITFINIQRYIYKEVAFYTAWTHSIFLSFHSLLYITIIGKILAIRYGYIFYNTAMAVIVILVGLVPIIYTFYLTCSWFVSKRK